MTLRDLSLHSPYNGVRRVIPQHPEQWTQAELAELRAFLESRGWFEREERIAWVAMESFRAQRLESMTAFPSNRAPHPKVLADTPLAWRASRATYSDPEIALLSHRIDHVLTSIIEAPGRATKAEAQRIHKAAHEWNMRTLGSAPVNGARLPGGLYLAVDGDRLKLTHLDQSADAPAAPGQLSRLRLLASLWRRLVTRVVAANLKLCVDTYPSVDSRLEYALCTPALNSGEAYVVEDGRIRTRTMQILSRQGDYNLVARMPVARALTRYKVLVNQYKFSHELASCFPAIGRRSVESLDVHYGPLDTSCLDDAARELIVPMREGQRVGWDDAADSYAVLRDDGYPYESGVFRELDTAIAFERANRYEGYRLRLKVAA